MYCVRQVYQISLWRILEIGFVAVFAVTAVVGAKGVRGPGLGLRLCAIYDVPGEPIHSLCRRFGFLVDVQYFRASCSYSSLIQEQAVSGARVPSNSPSAVGVQGAVSDMCFMRENVGASGLFLLIRRRVTKKEAACA